MITVENKTFHLRTKNSSYLFGEDEHGNLLHYYYGARISDMDAPWNRCGSVRVWSLYEPEDEAHTLPLQAAPFEYGNCGRGELAPPALQIEKEGGHTARYLFDGYRTGVSFSCGALPQADGPDDTLQVFLLDPVGRIRLTLCYAVFEDCDVIARSVRVENLGISPVYLERAMSLCLPLPCADFDFLRLHGRWAKERSVVRTPVSPGVQSISSVCGESSHMCNPFFALPRRGTNAEHGEAYSFNLLYSGNFTAEICAGPYETVRVTYGIHPQEFQWKLDPGEVFDTPQAVLCFSSDGLDGMSHRWHRFVRRHICRGEWSQKSVLS